MFLVVILDVINYHLYEFGLIRGIHHFSGGAPPPFAKFSESLIFLLLNDGQLSIVRVGLNIGLVSRDKDPLDIVPCGYVSGFLFEEPLLRDMIQQKGKYRREKFSVYLFDSHYSFKGLDMEVWIVGGLKLRKVICGKLFWQEIGVNLHPCARCVIMVRVLENHSQLIL